MGSDQRLNPSNPSRRTFLRTASGTVAAIVAGGTTVIGDSAEKDDPAMPISESPSIEGASL